MAGHKCWSHKTVTSLNHYAPGQSNRVFQVNGKLPSNPFLSGTMNRKKKEKKTTKTKNKKKILFFFGFGKYVYQTLHKQNF